MNRDNLAAIRLWALLDPLHTWILIESLVNPSIGSPAPPCENDTPFARPARTCDSHQRHDRGYTSCWVLHVVARAVNLCVCDRHAHVCMNLYGSHIPQHMHVSRTMFIKSSRRIRSCQQSFTNSFRRKVVPHPRFSDAFMAAGVLAQAYGVGRCYWKFSRSKILASYCIRQRAR